MEPWQPEWPWQRCSWEFCIQKERKGSCQNKAKWDTTNPIRTADSQNKNIKVFVQKVTKMNIRQRINITEKTTKVIIVKTWTKYNIYGRSHHVLVTTCVPRDGQCILVNTLTGRNYKRTRPSDGWHQEKHTEAESEHIYMPFQENTCRSWAETSALTSHKMGLKTKAMGIQRRHHTTSEGSTQ